MFLGILVLSVIPRIVFSERNIGDITLRACHIPGRDSYIANFLSRDSYLPMEWLLHQDVVKEGLPCFTCLTNLLIDNPRLLFWDKRVTNTFHPEPQKLNLTLWPILGNMLRRQGFQKGLQIMAVKFLRIGTRDTYDSLLHRFYKLCPESQTDPASHL